MRIGIDLGGTKTEIAVLDPDGAVAERRRQPTPAGDYPAVLEMLAGMVASVEPLTGPVPVGIGIPGSVSPVTGQIRNANSTYLIGRMLDRDVSARIGRPVRLENDANCFALAEANAGAGVGAECVWGLILGTGTGSGIVRGGTVMRGRNLIAGEWGHNPLPWADQAERPGPACYCGRHGCVETWCSGPGLASDYERRTGTARDVPEIVARAGDEPAAAETLALHLDRTARAMASVINVLDPDVVVLGGGLSNLAHLQSGLPGAIRPFIFSDTFDTPIRVNRLGDSAGVIGAAWLWPDPSPQA